MDVFEEILTTKGRLNRQMHLKYQMIWISLNILAGTTSSVLITFLTGNDKSDWIDTICGVLFYIALIGFFMLLTRRLHDLNFSGFFSILIFIPLIGVFFLIAFFFAQGQVGKNQYGEEPFQD